MSHFSYLSEEKEVVSQAEVIQKQVDEIFELARTNNWDFEQFAKKILAGAVEYDLGYFAIAAQLVQHVTGLEGIKAIQLLRLLLAQVKNLDTVRIKQAQEIFVHGLIINKQKQKQKQKQGNYRNRKRHENFQK